MFSTSANQTETSSIPLTSFTTQTHDSQIELNSYHINYIEDSSVQSESRASGPLTSVIEENPCRLEVSHLPEEIFTDEIIQCEFECIFHEFDSDVIISYSEIFQRANLTFSDSAMALQVRANMNGKEFHDRKLHISHLLPTSSNIRYLRPPNQERIFMQSPPTTPPVGWVAKREELPEINFDLFLALSKLQPNEPLEILPSQNNLPSIIIHPCSDTSDDENDLDEFINPIIDEFGHKKYATIEAKRRAQILHDAILVPDEQQIRQTVGDGDRLIT